MKRRNARLVPGSQVLLWSVASVFLVHTLAQGDPVLRAQQNLHGDFAVIGNSMGFDCRKPTAEHPIPLPTHGSVDTSKCGNNTEDTAMDVLWQVDKPTLGQAQADTAVTPGTPLSVTPPGTASTEAVLQLPAGAVVTYARIYWSASAANVVATPGNQIILSRKTADRSGTVFSIPLTADVMSTVPHATSTFGTAYQGSADITDLVKTQGPGAFLVQQIVTDKIKDVDLNSIYGGWWMAVFYQLPTEPTRQVSLFDDLTEVSAGAKSTLTTQLSGFLVPTSGFDAKLAIMAWEGDEVLTGDQMLFNGNVLSNALNDATNFFNGTRSWFGMPVSVNGDLPQRTGGKESMTGFDLDVMNISSYLNSGDTSATIKATTSGDTYFLAGYVTSISSLVPVLEGTVKTYQNTTGDPPDNNKIKQGDVVEYTLRDILNSGSAPAIDVELTDVLSSKVTYVPGSLQVAKGTGSFVSLTDANGDDTGEYDTATRTIRVRLGTGATAVVGGTLPVSTNPADAYTVKFKVMVNTEATGLVSNQGKITFKNGAKPSLDPQISWTGDGVHPNTPTTFPIFICDVNADCKGDKPFCDTHLPDHVCTTECKNDEDCTSVFGKDWVCAPINAEGPRMCSPTADLALVVTPSIVNDDNEVTFEVQVNNLGPGTAPSAVVTFSIPEHGTWVGTNTSSAWNCNFSNDQEISCASTSPLEVGISSAPIGFVIAGDMGQVNLHARGTVKPVTISDLHLQNNTAETDAPLLRFDLRGGGLGCSAQQGAMGMSWIELGLWCAFLAGCLGLALRQAVRKRKP